MILDPTLTMAYVVVAAALALSPGPDVLFVLASGMRHRVSGAVASAFGIAAGALLHAMAAAVGILALIAATPLGFDLLRVGGAIYLTYLGLRAFCAFLNPVDGEDAPDNIAHHSPAKLFQRGLITNVLNPKVVIFYIALLPQFVNPELGHVGVQIFLLGCIHNLIGLAFLIGVGAAAGRASGWLMQTRFRRWLDAVAGVFFVGLALRLAVTGRPH